MSKFVWVPVKLSMSAKRLGQRGQAFSSSLESASAPPGTIALRPQRTPSPRPAICSDSHFEAKQQTTATVTKRKEGAWARGARRGEGSQLSPFTSEALPLLPSWRTCWAWQTGSAEDTGGRSGRTRPSFPVCAPAVVYKGVLWRTLRCTWGLSWGLCPLSEC